MKFYRKKVQYFKIRGMNSKKMVLYQAQVNLDKKKHVQYRYADMSLKIGWHIKAEYVLQDHYILNLFDQT